MKRFFSFIVFAFVTTGTIQLRAADPRGGEGKACSVATLRGTYLLSGRLDAPQYAPITGVPQVVGGLRAFDAAGNISGVATVNAGGTILQNVRAPGVYTVNADCTGTMTNAGTRHYDIYVAADGSEAVAIRTDPDAVEILRFTKVGGPSGD
jgi:hypothetical protein